MINVGDCVRVKKPENTSEGPVLTVVDLVVRFGCQCAACVTLRSGEGQYRVTGTDKHHDECTCNDCKIAKRPPPQCAVDCYDCGPPCRVLADRERQVPTSEAITKYAAPLAMGPGRESGVAKLAGLPPRHPIYKWTGPIPWTPEEY